MQRLIEVQVEKMSLGGQGIARHQGQVVFIPFAAPGDLLKVNVTAEKKNFLEAEIVEILSPGPARISAPCPVYGRCGGCNFQHLTYAEQLRQKQMIVEEQLKKFLRRDVSVLPIVPSPHEFNYRNRIQIKSLGTESGFFAKNSHAIVDIDTCLIAEEPLNKKFAELRGQRAEVLTRTQLSLDSQGKVLTSQDQEDESSDGFAQINRFQNENLISTLLHWLADSQFPEIWDLYAGAGNFTLPLSQKFTKSAITAVELSQRSVEKGQKRLREFNVSPKKFRLVLANVAHFVRRHILADSGFILLDPPRTGCDSTVIDGIAAQKFKSLIYISCNPSTLGRDLERLFARSDRKLTLGRVQAFDMFPQTDHVEVMAEILTSD